MRVGRVSAVGAILANARVMESPVVQRLNSVRKAIRRHGAVILQDNKIDNEVISRLKKQFGEENVNVEKSKTIKLSIDNFKR